MSGDRNPSSEENLGLQVAKCFRHVDRMNHFLYADSLDLLVKNKASLIAVGASGYDEAIDEWVGHPFWLYPAADFLTAVESERIDRNGLYELKLEVLKSLPRVNEPSWMDWFTELLGSFVNDAGIGQFYLSLDRLYAFQCLQRHEFLVSEIHSRWAEGGSPYCLLTDFESFEDILPIVGSYQNGEGDPGCSGGLSDIIEMVYPYYEHYYFGGAEKLKARFPQVDPTDSDHSIRMKVSSEGNTLSVGENVRAFGAELRAFRDDFLRTMNGALGVGELSFKKVAHHNFVFYQQLVRYRPTPFFEHGDTYGWVRYGEELFHLNDDQATIIGAFHRNYLKDRNKPVPSNEIWRMSFGNKAGLEEFRLGDKFKDGSATRLYGKARAYLPVFHRLIEEVPSPASARSKYYQFRLPALS